MKIVYRCYPCNKEYDPKELPDLEEFTEEGDWHYPCPNCGEPVVWDTKPEQWRITPKADLVLEEDIHTWTKGEVYTVIQVDSHIKIGTDQGQINYINEVKNEVLKEFNLVEEG